MTTGVVETEGEIVHRFTCLPKQRWFIKCDADEVLYSGAYGAGKTLALCLKLVARASQPGAREGLFRRQLSDLYNTTLTTLLKGDGMVPPVLPLGSYTINHQRRTIDIDGGGTIVFGPCDNEDDINSLNLTGAAVDEAVEVSEDLWLKLGGRCRVNHPTLKRQVYAACNPGPPSHHLARRFGIVGASVIPEKSFTGTPLLPLRCDAVTTNTLENPHLPPDAVARYMSYTGILKARYVEGKWVGSEGVIFDNWDRTRHLMRREGPWKRVLIGVDEGTTDPFVAVVVGVDAEDRRHVLEMTYRRQMLQAAKVETVAGYVAKYAPEVVVIDRSASSLKLALRSRGLTVADSESTPGSIRNGIEIIRGLLADGPDGRPCLTADPVCEDFATEMESYEWHPDALKERPLPGNDHSIDAVRYVMERIHTPPDTVFRPRDFDAIWRGVGENLPTVAIDIRLKTRFDTIEDEERAIRQGKLPIVASEGGPWYTVAPEGLDQERAYCMAVSVGSGSPESPTWVLVGDTERREVVAWARFDGVSPEQVARRLVVAARWFGGLYTVRIGWKRYKHGPGVVFGETLRRLGWGGVYTHVDSTGSGSPDPGWWYTTDGIHALVGEMRESLDNDRYRELCPHVANALGRWVHYPGGHIGPASLDAAGETVETATDAGFAAVLLNHMFSWSRKLPAPVRKSDPYSVEWLYEREGESFLG